MSMQREHRKHRRITLQSKISQQPIDRTLQNKQVGMSCWNWRLQSQEAPLASSTWPWNLRMRSRTLLGPVLQSFLFCSGGPAPLLGVSLMSPTSTSTAGAGCSGWQLTLSELQNNHQTWQLMYMLLQHSLSKTSYIASHPQNMIFYKCSKVQQTRQKCTLISPS